LGGAGGKNDIPEFLFVEFFSHFYIAVDLCGAQKIFYIKRRKDFLKC
jgi:hypothetical protein